MAVLQVTLSQEKESNMDAYTVKVANMREFMRVVNLLARRRLNGDIEDVTESELRMVKLLSGIFCNEANYPTPGRNGDVVAGEYYAIKFQSGPVGEVLRDEYGSLVKEADEANGCQIEDILAVLIRRLKVFNDPKTGELWPGIKMLPCRENAIAITKMEEALLWLKQRTENRKRQGVEGTSKPHVS